MKIRLILSVIMLLILPGKALAGDSYTSANYYPISGKVQEGTIITVKDGRYTLSDTPYDKFMIGTITNTPAVTQKFSGPIPFYPVVNSGVGYVLVSTINGTIKKGDYITSSVIPGVGQKTTEAENAIGIAEVDFNVKNKNVIGKIPITISIHNSTATGGIGSLTMSEMLSVIPRYILAVFIIAVALIVSFKLVSKTAGKAIEALGRNPLASRQIHIEIVLNVFIAFVILYTGFTTGYLILKL